MIMMATTIVTADDNRNCIGSTAMAAHFSNKMMRSRYSISKKLKFVADVTSMTSGENAMSIRKACSDLNIEPKSYRLWKRQIYLLRAHKLAKKSTKFRMHSGRPPSIIGDIEEELVEWILLQREVGLAVDYCALIRKLGQLDPQFRRKSPQAKLMQIRRLSTRNKFVYRAATHTAQRLPDEVKAEAQAFVEEVVPILAAVENGQRHKDYIINMDQTPVFFSMTSRYTLNLMGERSIPVRGTQQEGTTSRATVFASITASGKSLKPLVVFKGTENGKVSREFREYDAGALYQAQAKAWCDERVMLFWINNVLRPYIETMPRIPENPIRPVLMLDRYSCHLMASVRAPIAEMGIDLIHVPGGCTSLAQPLDVGYNKPFKSRIKAKFEFWKDKMIQQHGDEKLPKVPRKLMARWIVKATRNINETIGKNAWLHKPYSYFPNEVTNEDR